VIVRILALIAGAVMVGLTATAILAVTSVPSQAPPRHRVEITLLPMRVTPHTPLAVKHRR
jgi:hypothetical protein